MMRNFVSDTMCEKSKQYLFNILNQTVDTCKNILGNEDNN